MKQCSVIQKSLGMLKTRDLNSHITSYKAQDNTVLGRADEGKAAPRSSWNVIGYDLNFS